MRKPLIIIRIYLISPALAAFWKRSRRLLRPLMEMAPGSVITDDRGCLASKWLARGNLRVESIIGFSRGSGR
ncbi:hypothetical protein PMI26_05744 [Pseudomonas sp. GM33]|uniref:hypothetical protein n=1 Tax=Pseudomonas sp. GM33 TaxID=1144329 RepID=UPI00026FFA8F|nr:hypothetical protein [Pseudomonas sp. GM33]EJM34537.1 hypothetical protein PMI26_05744 [Pseudomonas sp. GM33]